MNKIKFFGSIAALVFAVVSGYLRWTENSASAMVKTTANAETQAVVTATTALLNTLSADQRQKVEFPFTPEKTATGTKFRFTRPDGSPLGPADGFVGEKYGQAMWSNFPVGRVPRPGLSFGDLSATQRDAVMHLLQVALSPKGYQKVLDIMGSDQALSETGTDYCSGIHCYTIGVFGNLSTTAPWMLEFGGHHLALNLVLAGEHGVITPTLTGAQPSVYTSNGKTVRALAAENDKAFDLLNALDENQQKQAILNYHVGDLVLGPGNAEQIIQPEGLKASAMNEHQRAMLLSLISEWAEIVNDAYAKPRMAEIKAGLIDTYFAWSGPTTHQPGQNGNSYYRIQGPKVVIEFSPQDTNGDPTLHVHTMYRDPTDDYGIKYTLPQ